MIQVIIDTFAALDNDFDFLDYLLSFGGGENLVVGRTWPVRCSLETPRL